MSTLTTPLSDDEFERLERLLNRLDPEDGMSLEKIDGFFCALVCGPNSQSLSEHIEYVVGPESVDGLPFHSVYANPEEARTLLTRHWYTIAATLMAGKPYIPVFDLDDVSEPLGHLWAEGFAEGMDLDRARWDRFSKDKHYWQLVAMPMLLLAEANPQIDPEGVAANIPRERRIDILTGIVMSLTEIFRHFHGGAKRG